MTATVAHGEGPPGPVPDAALEPGPRNPVALVAHRRLAEQVAELVRRDGRIRRGRDGDVHQARVACRKLRSALATYRPLLEPAVTEPLREELRWLGTALGSARDSQVVRDRLTALVGDEDDVVGPVQRRIEASYDALRAVAVAEVATTLESARHRDLLVALERLVVVPPWTDLAGRDARDVVPDLVREDWRRLRRRVEALDGAEDRDRAFHEVRKAAKRLRYAAESLEPVWGRDAKRLGKAATRITALLGERQDTVMSRADLVALSADAVAAGESGFTYARLNAREQGRADELDLAFDDAWRDLRRAMVDARFR
ncbi:MAG TPA: CHAD domain-containing protein [Nocardioides sp.]|nr:CHAD domain-containing protein [Nocardioides sp.]